MAKAEKFIPRRINKDTDPGAVDRGGDRLFLPGDLLDAVNCRMRNGVVKSIPGTIQKEVEALAGTSLVIGTIANERDNTIIYFVYNSSRNNRIYEYDPIADTVTTLFAEDLAATFLGSALGFASTSRVQGCVIDKFLIFGYSDKRTRKINLETARAGGYTSPYMEQELSLHAYPPIEPPTCVQITDAAKEYNYVSDQNWQFCYRYVYNDNEETVFSMLSLPVLGRIIPDPTDSSDNGIRVTVPFDTELEGLVKRIDVAYREGNNGDYRIFKKILNPSASSTDVDFFNDDFAETVPKKRETQLYDAFPDQAEAVEVVKNRVFFPLNDVGFDVDESDFTLTAEAEAIVNSPSFYAADPFFKQGSTHGVGIVFFGGVHKPSFVKAKKYVTIPREDITGTASHMRMSNTTYKISWELAGTPPAGAEKYAIVITKDTRFSAYAQCISHPFKYLREIRENEDDNEITSYDGGSSTIQYYNWRGKRFAGLAYEQPETARLYLQIPVNLPFVPEAGDHIRVLNTDFPDKNLYVHEVVGDFIDVGNAKFGSTTDLSAWINLMIEIYRPTKQRTSDVFYEIAEIHDIPPERTFPTASGTIDGDTHPVQIYNQSFASVVGLPFYFYDFVPALPRSDDSGALTIPQGDPAVVDTVLNQGIESPVTIMAPRVSIINVFTRDPINFPERKKVLGFEVGAIDGEALEKAVLASFGNSQKKISVHTLDYTKITGPYGRAHTTNDNEKNQDLDTTLGFTDPYIQNSYVNGLNVVPGDQVYSIPVDRGRIRCLKRAGNVLVAIHENNASTLYIGEGLVRQGENFILAKTEKVVGDDRKLRGGYGTINPESVIEVYDNLYWWDGLNGAVVRYTNAGLFPISNYGMHDYFLAKARDLLPHKDTVRVVTGFDYENDELLVTFAEAGDVEAETWAFSIKDNEWKTRYSFIPECYGTLKTGLYSFKDAELWKHGLNPIHNNFYGVQYERAFTLACNPQLGKNKKFLNVHVKGELCDDETSDFVPVRLTTPEGQETYTPAYEFELDEGKWCGPVLKDINTPSLEANQLALRSGDDIFGAYAEVEVINDRTDAAPCSQVNMIYKNEEFSI